jgi:uncharacterized protein YtpQ (UPF0354 family)
MFGLEKLFQRQPSKPRFAQDLLKNLRVAHPDKELVYDEAQYQIRIDKTGVVNLHNLYIDYCRGDKETRHRILTRSAEEVAVPRDIPGSLDEARAQLLPVLRHMAGLDLTRLDMNLQALDGDLCEHFALVPLSTTLAIAVAYDTEHAVHQVDRARLANWGVTLAQAHDIAVDNLRHKAAPAFEQIVPGVYLSRFGDFYDAVRLLLPELAWQLNLGGTPVAMVPNRTCLLLASDENQVALNAMVSIAERILLEEPRPLGADMFRAGIGGFVEWWPADDLGSRLRNLQIRCLSTDYQDQQNVLRQMLARQGQADDIFVATYIVMMKEGQALLQSYSVLTSGVPTWLPKTDLVGFMEQTDASPLVMAWEQFAEIAGNLLEPLPYVLPRYRVTRDPDDEQLARMRALPTP